MKLSPESLLEIMNAVQQGLVAAARGEENVDVSEKLRQLEFDLDPQTGLLVPKRGN